MHVRLSTWQVRKTWPGLSAAQVWFKVYRKKPTGQIKDQNIQRDWQLLVILSNVPFGASSWFDKGCGSDASLAQGLNTSLVFISVSHVVISIQETNDFCDPDPERCDDDGRYMFIAITSYPDFLIRYFYNLHVYLSGLPMYFHHMLFWFIMILSLVLQYSKGTFWTLTWTW